MSWFVCPACRSNLELSELATDKLACAGCMAVYPITNGVPLFMDEEAGTAMGLAEATFNAPKAYGLVVALKRLAFKDAELGTRGYVAGKDVLDVGCGPSLNFAHLENHHSAARRYVGIDTSAAFVVNARLENPDLKYSFAQSPASRIPLPDKSVDTSIVSFTIHHINSEFERVMPELIRVTRETIIILDHLKSANPVLGGIQNLYWKFFDGGCAYQTDAEWKRYLFDVDVLKTVRTGAIFGHVVKYACRVRPVANDLRAA